MKKNNQKCMSYHGTGEKDEWETSSGSSVEEEERWKLKPDVLEEIAKKEAEMAGNMKIELENKTICEAGSSSDTIVEVETPGDSNSGEIITAKLEVSANSENMKIELENREESGEISNSEQEDPAENLEVTETLGNMIVEMEISVEDQAEQVLDVLENIIVDVEIASKLENPESSDQFENENLEVAQEACLESENIETELENKETSEEASTSQKDSNSPRELITSAEPSSSAEYKTSIDGLIKDKEDLEVPEVWRPESKNRELFFKRCKILEKHVESLEKQKAKNEAMAEQLVDEFCDFVNGFVEKISKTEKVEKKEDPRKFQSWCFTGDLEVKSTEFYNWKNAFCRELIENELEMRTAEIFDFLSNLYRKFEPRYGQHLSLSKIAAVIDTLTINEMCRKSAIQKFERHFRVKIPVRV
ncbi:unnamed protein product [Caenorhabditis angaria]|uniref:Uncharacterized protein n=1 Tax=Caenorhabditis angaria TaxID=860376 RepID=A0A9P1IJM5_9PELO|nr:unnamed protein product [Caenorhabditis angaria]